MLHTTRAQLFRFTFFVVLALAPATSRANPIIIDLVPGPQGNPVTTIVAGPSGGYLATTVKATGGARLYKTDGTGPGTAVIDNFPKTGTFAESPHLLSVTGGKLLYQLTTSTAVWAHDGTFGGHASIGTAPADLGFLRGALPNGTGTCQRA